MALISCPECAREVSELAETCPTCGCPLRAKRENNIRNQKSNDIQTVLLILSILAIVISAFYLFSISMLHSSSGIVYLAGDFMYQVISGLVMLFAGIIFIATTRIQSSVGLKTAYWLYLVAALCSFSNSNINMPNMLIFPIVNIIYCIIFLFLSLKQK